MAIFMVVGASSIAYAESSPTDYSPLVLKPLDIQTSAAPTLNDPTKPVESIKYQKTESKIVAKIKMLDVQIISYKPNGGSFVVINGKRFIEGDAFDETTIKKIEKNKVVLSNPDRKPLVLEYANLSIKKGEGTKP
jgi:hypothetical protein